MTLEMADENPKLIRVGTNKKKKVLRNKKKKNKKNVKDRKYFQLGRKGKHYQANMFPKNVICGHHRNYS